MHIHSEINLAVEEFPSRVHERMLVWCSAELVKASVDGLAKEDGKSPGLFENIIHDGGGSKDVASGVVDSDFRGLLALLHVDDAVALISRGAVEDVEGRRYVKFVVYRK
jgi:hypothetical protein